MDKSSEILNKDPIVVGIGTGEDYGAVTRKAVEHAGGLESVVGDGAVVIIKPNVVTGAKTDQGMVTDYRVVQEIVDLVKKCGAAKITIAEASTLGNMFQEARYHNIIGADLWDMNECGKEDCYEIQPIKGLTGKNFLIPKKYLDADVVIGAAKLKTHFEYDAVVSLSLKNSIGICPNSLYGEGYFKDQIHYMGLKEAIVDLNKIRKPDFVVIDGIVGGEGYGPLKARPVKSKVIFAGKDPVAVDTIALNFMGFTVEEVPHVKLADQEGLGVCDLNRIQIVGADLNTIKMKFRSAQDPALN
ncbi:DUF362 domain-containing protein [Candidatus Formimonas warabiya]|uniref:DUF362 domain-containing protein n=1 Tax=Formimonas warabiya TaxID=1761012 RepID=A0A3G1KN01_FORW1|nr:DUF362 domain-containing protein [Candidatus Formimonas warabiya]ATW23829.1 hypothetical protein DCMF_02570 [Candidatus Formimonas warabiya]